MTRKAFLIPTAIVAAVILGETLVTVSPALGMVLHSGLLVSLLAVASLLREPASGQKPEKIRENPGPTELHRGVPVKTFEVSSAGSGSSPGPFSGSLGSKALSNFLLAVAIVPLIRVFSLAMPLWFFPEISWYLIASLPMLAAAVFLASYQGLGADDLGLTLNRFPLQIALAFTGVGFGLAEYFILEPEPLVESLTFGKVAIVALVLIWGTGFVEELTFRGVVQKNAIGSLGAWPGLLFVALVFACLHIGNSPLDAAFVFPIALFFGVLVWKTKSILGATLSHGVTNVVLFIAAPLLIG